MDARNLAAARQRAALAALANSDFGRILQLMQQESKEDKNKTADADDGDEVGKLNITSPMKPDDIEKTFSVFENAFTVMKEDRDKMMAEEEGAPVPRFTKRVMVLARFSSVEPAGNALSRKDVSAFKEKMSNFFLKKRKVGSASVSYFDLITDVFGRFCRDLFSPSNSINAHKAQLLSCSLALFHNLTDCSSNFSRQVASNDNLMKAFLEMIQRFSGGHINKTLHEAILQLLIATTGVVYNIVRLSDSNNIMRVRELGMVEAVKPLLKSNRVGIKDHAMLILIFAASEDDSKECCCDEPTINFLLVRLKQALSSARHRGAGYSDIELMEAIRKLAVIDVNKKILAKLKCLEIMKEVLAKCDDEEVLSLAFGILSQLAFDSDNAKWINKELQSLLDSKFMKSSQPHLKEAARNLKWVTEVETAPPQASGGRPQSAVLKRPASARPTTQQKHIMISYNHASKDFVKKLVQALENAKMGKVWVDFSNMKENWLDDMAFAVENAWVVLACVSLKYKDSENCKSEALYAKKLKVPIIPLKVEKWSPDGWLGILIASLTYFDFSKEDSSEQILGKLLTALREKRGGKDSVDAQAPIQAATSQPTQSEPPTQAAFCKWTCQQVQKWCQKNAIPCAKCKDVDGEQLQMLREMYRSDTAVFYRELQDSFKFNLKEKSAFVKALNAL